MPLPPASWSIESLGYFFGAAGAERMLESSEIVLSIAERSLARGVLPSTPLIKEAVASLKTNIERAKAQKQVTVHQMAEVTVSATRVTKLIRRSA